MSGTNFEQDGDAMVTEYVVTPGAELATWAARYPAHAREFARVSAESWMQGGSPMMESADDASAERVRSIGMRVLRERRAAYSIVTEAAGALSDLKEAAAARGLAPRQVAEALSLPDDLFWKLHRRLLVPESVPSRLIARLAETIGRTVDDVAAYLRQPPALAAGASYRADTAPEAKRETFAEALARDTETTDSMRDCWRGAE